MVCYPILDDSPEESVAFVSPVFCQYRLDAVQHPQVLFEKYHVCLQSVI
jgi:hypothetical protein